MIYDRTELIATIDSMATRVARSLRAFMLNDEDILDELERELEWFLTWRLKLPPAPTVMWCDGVRDLSICSRGDLCYEVNARAYVGPEADASTILCAVFGTITLEEIADRLHDYELHVAYMDQPFVVTYVD